MEVLWKCICQATKKLGYYNLIHDSARRQYKKEKEPDNDAPVGNLASSTDDIPEDEKIDSDNVSFTGIWLSQVIDHPFIYENIVSVSVFDDITVEGDDVGSMNLDSSHSTSMSSDSLHSTTSSNSNILPSFHTPVLIIEQEQEENSDSTSISDTSINLDHITNPYLRCLTGRTSINLDHITGT